jgi:uncharacterized protein YjbI with pentapeptide repeats
MADKKHLAILRQGVDAWNAWRGKGRRWVRPDLSEAGLCAANLRMANLMGANLIRADLRLADLSEADLRLADLREADLSEADLSGANLSLANLMGAKLIRPNLSGANLHGAKLHGANLHGAKLHGANLSGANLNEAHLIRANLRGADFSWADLSGADLGEANLNEADLIRANLREADLRLADLREADLSEANLSGANLIRANLIRAKLIRANLGGAKLDHASLIQANLVDAYLDGADLTGAELWETQRGGWSIKNVICPVAFWDRDGEEPTKYEEGEFERIFAEKPRIILRYGEGISSIDLIALPLAVERLQAKYPGSALQIRSMQTDAGGASVTITVEDLTGRDPEAFEQERKCLETELKCVVEERDRLWQCLGPMLPALHATLAEALSRPWQVTHIHNPRAPIAIEGSAMSRDTYNIPGQAAAVGPDAHAHDNVFIQAGIDLPKLAEELGRLRAAMKGETTGTREQDKAIVAVADAEEAAAKGDGPAALQYLKSAGNWTLGIAEKIGVPLAVEALKRVM